MTKVDEIFEKARLLPDIDREFLALKILKSLRIEPESTLHLSPEDEAELDRRLDMLAATRQPSIAQGK
jgi:hypothetical protein